MGCHGLDSSKQIAVPMYALDAAGMVLPNPLFHRPVDRLHSRCIEYPYAASRMGNTASVLDVGTVKADPAWIAWLEHFPAEVYGTDYDVPPAPFKNIRFHQADIRALPFSDGAFEKVVAVSVIEHIGLESPQVVASQLPRFDANGDLVAFRELARVVKSGGELIMTVPFGRHEGLILGNEARSYTQSSLAKFGSIMDVVELQYYEYQCSAHASDERYMRRKASLKGRLVDAFLRRYRPGFLDDIPGEVTWRNIPPECTRAVHRNHVEGVMCGVWRKRVGTL